MALAVPCALAALCGALAERCASMRAKRARDGDAREREDAVKRLRCEERAGRTRAERALREALCEVAALRRARGGAIGRAEGAMSMVYEARAIGTFASAFDRRMGTPRQGGCAPLARGRVTLESWVSGASLEGLEEFTHAWLIYVFHENTDLGSKAVGGGGDDGAGRTQRRTTARAKIRVPRLNGDKRGCLATRTPHRPCNSCPIGLSLVEIVRVRGASMDVAGADLVHGTPILDIKPYVPYSDSMPSARAPSWVSPEDGPLAVASVATTEEGEKALRAAWERRSKISLYDSADDFIAFVVQVLGRDIRSYHQRLKGKDDDVKDDVEWRVSLDGVTVVYRQTGKDVVIVNAT